MRSQITTELTINSSFSQLRNELEVANRVQVAERRLKPRFLLERCDQCFLPDTGKVTRSQEEFMRLVITGCNTSKQSTTKVVSM